METKVKEVEIFRIETNTRLDLPLYSTLVACGATGFPSPADDYLETSLDLNQYLNTKPNSTFFARATGESMKDAGISESDLLVIDRSVKAGDGDIVVCSIEGELLVKTLRVRGTELYLVSENPEFKPVKIVDGNELIIFGVVTSVVKDLRKKKRRKNVRVS